MKSNDNLNSESSGGSVIGFFVSVLFVIFQIVGGIGDCTRTSGKIDNIIDLSRNVKYYDDIVNPVSEITIIDKKSSSISIDSRKLLGNKMFSTKEEEFYKDFFSRNNCFTIEDQLLLKKVDKIPFNEYMKQLEQFGNNMNDLIKDFGNESNITVEYKKAYLETNSLVEAKNSILPNELINLPKDDKRNILFSLLKGEKLNAKQAETLSRITNKSIPETPIRFNDYILIEPNNESIIVKTINSTKLMTVSNILESINVNKSTRVILKGQIDDEIIKYLSDKEIKFVRYFDSFFKDFDIPQNKVRFIYVASKDRNIIKDLFGVSEDQVDDILKTVEKIDNQSYSIIVETQEQLINSLNKMKSSGDYPIVVFNNINNLLFGRSPKSMNIDDFITCKSYGIDGVQKGHITSDFIYFDDFVDAIKIAKSDDIETVDDLWYSFSMNYNLKLSKRNNKKLIGTVVFGTTVLGGGAIVIYYNVND